MEVLTAQELALLRTLQVNSKFDINELVKTLNMSRTTVYEKIKKLEQEGFISGYVALINRRKLGLHLTVFCTVTLTSQVAECVETFSTQAAALDEVVECYVTGGIFDYILKVVVKDLEDYNHFVTRKLSVIPYVSQVKSAFVMNDVKGSGALPF